MGEAGQATALVVDAEVTSYLMMGALSPGLKRHSVTLFEGKPLCGTTCTTSSNSSLSSKVGNVYKVTGTASSNESVVEGKGLSGTRSGKLLHFGRLCSLTCVSQVAKALMPCDTCILYLSGGLSG